MTLQELLNDPYYELCTEKEKLVLQECLVNGGDLYLAISKVYDGHPNNIYKQMRTQRKHMAHFIPIIAPERITKEEVIDKVIFAFKSAQNVPQMLWSSKLLSELLHYCKQEAPKLSEPELRKQLAAKLDAEYTAWLNGERQPELKDVTPRLPSPKGVN